jgi:hypothetical protein
LPIRAQAGLILLALAAAWAPGCSEPSPPCLALVPGGFEQQWKSLPHRLSLLELSVMPPAESDDWQLVAQNDGGTFGGIDRTSSRVNFGLAVGRSFRIVHGSIKVEIPASQSVRTAAASLTDDDLALDTTWEATPFLRGFRLSTDDYTAPPPWSQRYNPAFGFTSTGFGVRVHDTERGPGKVTFSVSVTHRLAPCDRSDPTKQDDMNGVIPLAASWITVYYSVISTPVGHATAGKLRTYVNYPQFAKDGSHVSVPGMSERTMTITGSRGPAGALVALQGFDLRSNDPNRKDPTCVITQKPECQGPGRYIRTIRARADLRSYDPNSGAGQVALDMRFDNDAPDGFKAFETGSMCVEATGEVVLLQFEDATILGGMQGELQEVKSNQRKAAPLGVCDQLPPDAPCG